MNELRKSKYCILYVAPSGSVHTQKWCEWFRNRGYEVHVATFDSDDLDGVEVHHLGVSVSPESSDRAKLAYLSAIKELRTIEKDIDADIVHVHYASSYGSVASFALRSPYYLSVWGADVYDFPKKSLLHRALIKRSLRRAEKLMSTSQVMADEASQYTDKQFLITPFGVDTGSFFPKIKQDDKEFVVGTVKKLSEKYGIDVMLKACSLALSQRPNMPLKVVIAGRGPEEASLKALASKLGLDNRVEWLGFVDHSEVPEVWQRLDVALIPSVFDSESFGVSAVEAQACGIPVVISDVPGLMEATDPSARIISPRSDVKALATSIVNLYDNPEVRREMGERGRRFVEEKLSLDKCFSRVLEEYDSYLADRNAVTG